MNERTHVRTYIRTWENEDAESTKLD